MSSPWKKQPEDVVDSVLKRAEVSKVSLPTAVTVATQIKPHKYRLWAIYVKAHLTTPFFSLFL